MGLRSQWAALPAVVSVVVPWAVVTRLPDRERRLPAACGRSGRSGAPRPSRAPGAGSPRAGPPGGRGRRAQRPAAARAPACRSSCCLRLRFGQAGSSTGCAGRCASTSLLWAAVAARRAVCSPRLGSTRRGRPERASPAATRRTFAFTPWPAARRRSRSYFSRAVVGIGFLPAAIGLPWLAVQVARGERARFAFAITVLLFGAICCTAQPRRLRRALHPLPRARVLLAATLAVACGEVSPLGLAITSVLLASCSSACRGSPIRGPSASSSSPAEMFYSRAIGLRLDVHVPGGAGVLLTLVPLALAVLGILMALLFRFLPRRLTVAAGGAILGAVAIVMIVETHYAVSKYVDGAGLGPARPSPTARSPTASLPGRRSSPRSRCRPAIRRASSTPGATCSSTTSASTR